MWLVRSSAWVIALLGVLLSPASASALDFEELTKAATSFFAELNPTSALKEFTSSYYSRLSREERFVLTARFPALFRIHFVCQLREEGKEPVALLPGDWVDSTKDASVHCPDGVEAKLIGPWKIQMQQLGEIPVLYVEKGKSTVNMGPGFFFVRTPQLFYELEGKGKAHQIELQSEAKGELIRCNRGNVSGKFRFSPAQLPAQLESFFCRMELVLSNGNFRYLYAQESVMAADLRLPSSLWPMNIRNAPPDDLARFGFTLTAMPSPAGNKISWNLLSPEGSKLRCMHFVQKVETEAAKQLEDFSSEKPTGEFPVSAELSAAFHSLVCEGDSFVLGSQSAAIAPVPWKAAP